MYETGQESANHFLSLTIKETLQQEPKESQARAASLAEYIVHLVTNPGSSHAPHAHAIFELMYHYLKIWDDKGVVHLKFHISKVAARPDKSSKEKREIRGPLHRIIQKSRYLFATILDRLAMELDQHVDAAWHRACLFDDTRELELSQEQQSRAINWMKNNHFYEMNQFNKIDFEHLLTYLNLAEGEDDHDYELKQVLMKKLKYWMKEKRTKLLSIAGFKIVTQKNLVFPERTETFTIDSLLGKQLQSCKRCYCTRMTDMK